MLYEVITGFGILSRRARGDMGLDGGIPQLPVGQGQRAVVGEGDRMVVGEIDADTAGEAAQRAAAALRYGAAGRRALHGDAGVGLAVGHVDGADGEGAVMAGETELRTAARSYNFV